MKKRLKSGGKKGFESAGQDEEVINLENMVSDNGKEDVLDLTNEISQEEPKSNDMSVIELTEKLPSSSGLASQEKFIDESSDNVIHLSDKAIPSLPSSGSEDVEEITHEDIMDLTDMASDSTDDDDLAGLTQQLESAMANAYDEVEDEEFDVIETLPEANLIEFDDLGDDDEVSDNFSLLPEAEPGMADNIDSLHMMEELGGDTSFTDIEMNDGDTEDGSGDISLDDDVSETALELNRAMMADRNNRYQGDDDNEMNEEIQNIRNKLDNVFPEESSQDPMAAFNFGKSGRTEDEDDDFDTDELLLPPFDEDESGALGAQSFGADVPPLDLKEVAEVGPRTKTQADALGAEAGFSNTQRAALRKNTTPFEAEASITESELEAAVRRVIETKYGPKIERIILQAIEKAVANEIAKIKKAILDESDGMS